MRVILLRLLLSVETLCLGRKATPSDTKTPDIVIS